MQSAAYQVADASSLKAKLAKAERRNKLKAFGLVMPLFLFIVVFFFLPIGTMLFRSVDNPEIVDSFPDTVEALQNWDPSGAPSPPKEVYDAFAGELAAAYKARTVGGVATQLNFQTGGIRSLFTKSARKISTMQAGPYQEEDWKTIFLDIDKDWGDREVWATFKQLGSKITPVHYLSAIDLSYDDFGGIVSVPDNRKIYVTVFIRTLWISTLVTAMCVLLGYPVSFLLANLPLKWSNLLMIFVLLPFWTSLLVRTTAWVVVLQTEGVLNDVLVFTHIISERIQLIFNRFGVVVAMTHILLPFMILPIFSVMKNISPAYVRAAKSLGGTDWTVFWRVYFPQTVPGIGAGGILVFILALGYYITPALVGGPTDQMISYFIADHTNRSLNWGLASALGAILLGCVLAVYLIYNRIVGIDNMKLG
ncbi:MAG: ABC transporter permease [Alphaproteobacteria bacterium]|nr:ABC transporter permease [Alphaproteobacteria bacterium]